MDYSKSSNDIVKIDSDLDTHEGNNNRTDPRYHAIWFSNTTCSNGIFVNKDDLQDKTLRFYILFELKLLFKNDGHAEIVFGLFKLFGFS